MAEQDVLAEVEFTIADAQSFLVLADRAEENSRVAATRLYLRYAAQAYCRAAVPLERRDAVRSASLYMHAAGLFKRGRDSNNAKHYADHARGLPR